MDGQWKTYIKGLLNRFLQTVCFALEVLYVGVQRELYLLVALTYTGRYWALID